MIAFVTLIYVLGIVLAFKVLKIKSQPKSIAVTVVVGIVLIGTIIIIWRFSSPSSSNVVASRYAVQIVSQVKGPIAKIHAQSNVPLKKGKDVLLEIQKEPYQYALDQAKANWESATKNVKRLEAGVRVADAAVKSSEASMASVKAELDVALEIQKINPAAVAKLKVTQLTEKLNAAKAALDQAKISRLQSDFDVDAAKATAVSLKARLASAQFDVERCTVYAPANGFVTNWQVREGTMAVAVPFASLGTFIDTEHVSLLASFGQNVIKNVKPGDPVEFSLKTRPGEVFPGTVDSIIQGSGEGQLLTSGQLITADQIGSAGMFIVKFRLDDENVAKGLAMGTAGTVVIYTDTGKPFQIISKVAVRIQAWMYYLVPF